MQRTVLASKKNVIILVVVAIATVLMFSSYYMKKDRLEKQTALGAQIELVSREVEIPKAEEKFLRSQATKYSLLADLVTSLPLPNGPMEANVRVIAIAPYPLYGVPKFDRGKFKRISIEDKAKKFYGVSVSRAFLTQSGMKMGDTFKMAELTYQIRGVVEWLPDEAGLKLLATPFLLLSSQAMSGSGMYKYASKRTWLYRITSNKISAARFEKEFKQRFPHSVTKINRWDQ